MKLSITQIILGVLIVFAACFIVGWMTYEAPELLRQPDIDEAGKITYIDVIPEHDVLFDISRYGSYLLPALGILLIISGAIQAARPGARTRKVAVITLSAGLITAAVGYIITVYGFPTSFNAFDPENSNRIRHFLGLMTKERGLTQAAAVLTSLFGLAATGCGIAQLIKAQKTIT